MESDGEFELLSSSPVVHERKLKRLKKATTAPEYPPSPPTLPTESEIHGPVEEELNVRSEPDPEPESVADANEVVEESGLGAKRVLEFDSVADGEVTEKGEEEIGDLKKSHESEKKRPSLDVVSENEENKKKKKKRIDDGGGDGSENEKNPKKSTSNKRKAEKERRENLKQLRAESQRLLRESRDASFKPIPLVQKPISSVLDKIRKRKSEIMKKFSASFDDDSNDSNAVDDGYERPSLRERIIDQVEKSEQEETPASCPAGANNDLSTSHSGRSDEAADSPSSKSIPSPVAMTSESERAFRAPIDDTQELFSDSQISDTKEEAVNKKLDNSPEQVFAPSMLSLNLELDSAPPDDDGFSDDEDNDKENIAPHLRGSAGSTSPPSGDPVKAFVDEEAEEEDDSDNDLQCFQDHEEEGEDEESMEELKDMIATQYEEKPVDREQRDQLHQQWLEQQDMAGMDNLLQKLNCGSKLKEPISIEEEDDESKETEYESDDDDDDVEDHIPPSEAMKINLKKAKQMLPRMFSQKEDAYVSSDDEEAEERLTKERLFYKAEKKTTFFSPAEDESSKEVFSLIKKLNIVPDPKRKGRAPTIFDMPRIGQSINISSKSSFVGRASSHFMPSSKKHGSSSKGRAYIFGRDESSSRTSVSISDDSSEVIQRESQVPKAASAKFQKITQTKYSPLNSASPKSNVSLFEILRKSSVHTERSVQNARVQQKETIFDAFKLAKKPIKTNEKV